MTDLPSGWKWSTVGEVADVQLGRQRSPQHHQGPNMHPYVRAANVTWQGMHLDDVKEMDFTPAEAQRFALEPGDILLNEASGSPNEVGKPAIWRGEIAGCCFQNTLLRVRSSQLVPSYLYWYLYGAALRGRFGEAARGVNIRHLGKKGLAQFPVPVAPPPEQKPIATVVEEQLSGIGAAETSLRSARHRLRFMKQAALSKAQDSSWPEMPLADLLRGIEAGKSFMTAGRPALDGEWGVIKVSAMTWGDFRERENKAVPDAQAIDPRHEIQRGDLLLSRANTSEHVGATVLVHNCRPKLLLSDKSMRLLPVDGLDKSWLQFALLSPFLRRQMSAIATGTSDSMRNISQAKVRALRVRVPPAGQQAVIAGWIGEQLSGVDRLASQIDDGLRHAASLSRSVLSSAFAGRLSPQHPVDEPASATLKHIRRDQATSPRGRPARAAG